MRRASSGLILRQLHFAQPEAGFDFGRVVGMILDELGIPLGRFGQLVQQLIAAGGLQLDLDPPVVPAGMSASAFR